MIKVIELVPTMNSGGAETMIKDYALLLDPKKINVQVVVVDRHYDTYNEKVLEEKEIKTVFLGEMLYGRETDLNHIQRILRRLSRYYYFRKLVKKEKPNIIHVHLVFDYYLRFLPLKKYKISLIYTVHNVIDNYFSKNKKDKKKYKEYKECKRLIDKYGMTLIALHDSMNCELREFFNTDRVITVNNGIQMERFSKELYADKNIRETLGFAKNDFIVGHVGRMHPQKNHDLILEIFVNLLQIKPNAKLLLIGKGELEKKVRAKIDNLDITDKVVMLKDRSDIPELMSIMDVFLFPSRWEGYGNVLLEAQCMDVFCVVSDKIPECVRVTNKVKVVQLDAPIEKWVEVICERKNADSVVADINDYNMRNCVKKIEEVYWNVVKHK